MRSRKIHFFLLFLLSFQFIAQNNKRVFESYEVKNHVITLKVNDGSYRIQFYNDYIVETSFIPNTEVYSATSHAVVLVPENKKVSINDENNQLFVSNGSIDLMIDKQPFQIAYYYNGKLVTSEKRGYFSSAHEPMDLVKGNIPNKTTEKIEFNLTSDEILYGGGARALGMNRRGKRLPLYNRAHYGYGTYSELMNYTLPLVISSKKYMLHFDNPPIGYLDLDSKKDNSLIYETISGRKTYQLIVGNSWQDLVEHYTDLTGKQPLPPRWAFGNFSSRFGYHSQRETEQTIAQFKKEEIPLDAVILDLYWFGKTVKGTMGNLEVDKDSFPDMKGMIQTLKDQGVKTVLITEPFVLTTSSKWHEADSKKVLATDGKGKSATYDFYFGNTGIVDLYKESARQWFWNIYRNNLIELGVAGLWGDLGEPEVLPSWVHFTNAKADEIHNIYGHDWARLLFEGYQKDYPNQRPFILMRAGYSGSQRFGMIPWSGDVSRSWSGLQSQPEISLQMGMQGLGYMHSDLGGFAGANLDDNLYVRWLQYGVFQPIFRPHAQEDVASEPVFRNKKTKQLAKEAIQLRYQLLPYNYNIAFENNQKGIPLMRPIFFGEDSSALLTNSSTYLWGNDFLITPILKDSLKTQSIYFPKSSNWFDFYTDEKMKGGQTKVVSVEKTYIPTYVRSGAFILLSKLVQSADDYHADDLELHYYHDAHVASERTYYNDDGITPDAFKKGRYEQLEFEAEYNKRVLEIDYEAEIGSAWESKVKNIQLIVHNVDWTPKKVTVNGKKVTFLLKDGRLLIETKWNPKRELKVKIRLK